MAYREIQRLPNQTQLQWIDLGRYSRDAYRRLRDDEKATVPVRFLVTYIDPAILDAEDLDTMATLDLDAVTAPYKPAGPWVLWAVGGGCARFATPSGELDEGDVAITDDEVVWKDPLLGYQRHKAQDVVVQRDVENRVQTLARRERLSP